MTEDKDKTINKEIQSKPNPGHALSFSLLPVSPFLIPPMWGRQRKHEHTLQRNEIYNQIHDTCHNNYKGTNIICNTWQWFLKPLRELGADKSINVEYIVD